jgi:hypothetical protein
VAALEGENGLDAATALERDIERSLGPGGDLFSRLEREARRAARAAGCGRALVIPILLERE